MDLTVRIPDDLASRLSAEGADLSRRALEAFTLEEYRNGHIIKAELRGLLSFQDRYDLDRSSRRTAFIKATRLKRSKSKSKT